MTNPFKFTCPRCGRRYKLVRRVTAAESDEPATATPVASSPAGSLPKPASDEVALAGKDGRQASRLLNKAKESGADLVEEITRQAVERQLGAGLLRADVLYNATERQDLIDQFAATNGTSHLLGRARVRLRALKVSDGTTLLAEEPTPLKATFAAAPIEPIPPDEALDYFRSLVPELGRDPRLTQRLERQAFTLAVNTERYVLGRVQRVIADALKTGAGVSRGVGSAAIDKILDAAGVGPTKRGYSEMVFRTNMMDSYNQGSMRELQQPDVADVFPAWKYLGVLDGREGDDHRPKFGRYYLTKDEFARVRGPRVYNCVLPGAAVGGEFVGGFRADYSGQAVKIETASGVRLAVTANHPVLTDRGFIPACQLKKGDRLANCRRYVKSDFFVEDNQDRPPRIEDVFDALAIAAPARRSSVVAGRLDFYGDGAAIKSEIDVVGADVFAQLNANSGGGECRCESLLRRPDMLRSLVPSRGSACHHFGAVALAAPSGLRGGDLSFAAVDVSDFAPLEPLRVGLAARLNVSRREPADDRRPADAELFGELIDGFSGVVTPDHIVDIKRFSYSGHVYDLATNVGYFAAGHNRNVGSIVIANCRCSFAPAMADEAKAAGLKFSEQDFCGGNGGKACVITGEEPPEFDDAAIKRALEERLAASDED